MRGGSGGATVSNNSFEYNGTGGLRLSGAGGASVSSNTFFQNRWEMPDGSGGGQLYFDYGASNIFSSLNYITGNNWQTGYSNINGCYPPPTPQAVYGVEVEPGSYNNYVWGDEITANTGAGITATSVSSLSISGYASGYPNYPKYIHNNAGNNPPFGNATNGIEINGASSGITLNGILSRNNDGYAVSIQSGTSGTGWQNYHCLTSNNVYLVPPYTTSYSLSNPTPLSTGTCP